MRSTLAAGAIAALALTSCGLTEANDTSTASNASGAGAVAVSSTDDACEVSTTEVGSGHVVFSVENTGSQVTEFYLYAEDGLRIIGEVENVGPGLTRDLVLTAAPGSYVTSCRPGMTGEGLRGDFTVTDSGADVGIDGVDQAAIDQATSQYAAYVEDQASQLVDATARFVSAYQAGEDVEARRLYPLARVHWERIETVAESFGDLDPLIDLREADLSPGERWTGWHRIEKDLWPPARGYTALTDAERATYGEDLAANIDTLHERVEELDYTVAEIGNGSKGLLDEVATGKITGEEDIWSHTDLYDFQANVDGARVAFEGLLPLLEVKDPALARTISSRFDSLQELLDGHRVGARGFVSYDTVGDGERKQLSDAVNALSEPLSAMTGAITL